MKILIGMTRSDTVVSGSCKHICQIGERFKQEGVEVIYILGGSGVAIDKIRSEGFKVYQLSGLKRDLSFLSDALSLLMLMWIIIKERPSVCSWHTAKIGALGRIAAMFTFCRSYYVPHGVPFVNTPENKGYKKFQILERVLSILPSKIIGVCQFDYNEYRRIGVSGKKLLVIPNGMKGKRNKQATAPVNSVMHFITAARFEAQKDYETLSKACKKLHKENLDFKLDIYGDGFMELDVKVMFEGLSAGSVNFKGVVDDFTSKLTEADVFVLSSFWEGLPRSIIEAMACNKAIIASNVGGNSELIINGETGYLVPIRDENLMFNAMKKYIVSPELSVQHGTESYKHYAKNYTLDVMLDRYAVEYGITEK